MILMMLMQLIMEAVVRGGCSYEFQNGQEISVVVSFILTAAVIKQPQRCNVGNVDDDVVDGGCDRLVLMFSFKIVRISASYSFISSQ